MKTALLATIAFLTGIVATVAAPGATWETIDPAAAGWSMPKLEEARAVASSLGATAFMVVQDGKVVASWGDVSAKVNVASVRKSLLSALYGIAVAEGRIDLDATLASLAMALGTAGS